MDSANWFVWALLSAVFAALTAIFAKLGVQNVHSDFATFIRTVVILVTLGGIVWIRGIGSNPLALPGKTLGFLVASGLATGASWLCYFRALQAGEVSKVAPVDKLSLLLVAVFAYCFLGERLTGWSWLGIALVGSGVLLLGFKK